MRKITAIVIHHSLSYWGSGEEIKRWHTTSKPQGNGWNHIGYHYVINNGFPCYNDWFNKKIREDWIGKIEKTLPNLEKGYHCIQGNMNLLSIGICCIGNFDIDFPHIKQLEPCAKLCIELMESYNILINHIYGHREWAHYKSCPGTHFDMTRFKSLISKLKGGT